MSPILDKGVVFQDEHQVCHFRMAGYSLFGAEYHSNMFDFL